MTEFIDKNIFAILTLVGSVLLTWGYLRWAIPDALQRLKDLEAEVEKMNAVMIELDKGNAVQTEKNLNHDRIHEEMLKWMKSLDTKIDAWIQRESKN